MDGTAVSLTILVTELIDSGERENCNPSTRNVMAIDQARQSIAEVLKWR